MNNIKYMLLDETLYAYKDDGSYYIARYIDGKWERTIPLLMISYNERKEINEIEMKELTNGILVDELFDDITKEIHWNNRKKTKKEIIIEFFEELIHCYKENYFLLKENNPKFKYSIKDLDETYGGNLYDDIEMYYCYYLELKEQLFDTLVLNKVDEDYIMEFIK
jgi:hypothetical protein